MQKDGKSECSSYGSGEGKNKTTDKIKNHGVLVKTVISKSKEGATKNGCHTPTLQNILISLAIKNHNKYFFANGDNHLLIRAIQSLSVRISLLNLR